MKTDKRITKQPQKRIVSVTIKRMTDTDPDTSHMGEYTRTKKSDYAIDRKHSLDCRINTGAPDKLVCPNDCKTDVDTPFFYPASTYTAPAETHNIDIAYARKTGGTCADCGMTADDCVMTQCQYFEDGTGVLAYPDAKPSNRFEDGTAGVPERITKAIEESDELPHCIVCKDEAEWQGCDCDESGDWSQGEYQYFQPSFNYITKDDKPAEGLTEADVRKYTRQDYERMQRLQNSDWGYIGIKAEAQIAVKSDKRNDYATLQTISSGGLWGIESDSDKSYIAQIEQEELAELKKQLRALGFGTRAISKAFADVKQEDE